MWSYLYIDIQAPGGRTEENKQESITTNCVDRHKNLRAKIYINMIANNCILSDTHPNYIHDSPQRNETIVKVYFNSSPPIHDNLSFR